MSGDGAHEGVLHGGESRGFPTDARIFLSLAIFFAVTAGLYGWLAEEWAGFVLLATASVFAGALFLYFMARARRETIDTEPDAPHDAAHVPYLPESSIWPLGVGWGLGLTLAGLALGLVVMLVGVALLLRSCIGWAAQSKIRS